MAAAALLLQLLLSASGARSGGRSRADGPLSVHADDGLTLQFDGAAITTTTLGARPLAAGRSFFAVLPFNRSWPPADAPVCGGSCALEFRRGTLEPSGARGLTLRARTAGYSLAATFMGRSDHIALSVRLSAAADAAVTLRFALPAPAGAGWSAGGDLNTQTALQLLSKRAVHAPRTRAFYVEQEHVNISAVPPFAADYLPLFSVLHAAHGGIAIATPVSASAPVIAAGASGPELCIELDAALTARSALRPRSASFELLLFQLDAPQWGFRSALDRYYRLFPAVFAQEAAILRQGNWLPFSSTDTIERSGDFGFAFQEGGSAGAAARKMNRDGVGIFPYLEPHVMHWPINKSIFGNYSKLPM